jgi:hypothetical protein
LLQAFTLRGFGIKIPVETNLASAVIWNAAANSGVPVMMIITVLRRAEAFTRSIIEIVASLALVLWVFNTNARASLSVVDSVN